MISTIVNLVWELGAIFLRFRSDIQDGLAIFISSIVIFEDLEFERAVAFQVSIIDEPLQ
jgi:hypothetical protein